MRGFNKVILVGNLARDPNISYTYDKRAMARFTVACNDTWRGRDGETQEVCDFVPVQVWGRLAEWCGQYLRKGTGVLVEGKVKTGSYEARDGSGKKYTFDIQAKEITLVGGKRPDRPGAQERDDEYGSPVSLPPEGESEAPDMPVPF